MITCICHGVSEEVIRESIRSGNWTCESIGRDCNAGAECGSCCNEICKMINEEKRKRLFDAVDRLTSDVNSSLDEIRKAVGDLTVNDVLGLISEAFYLGKKND
jgi:bacterioferritin-associated ferredoxin